MKEFFRSMRSIIFILEAEYHPNESKACGYDIQAVERERRRLRQLEEENRFYNVKLARYMRELYMVEEKKSSIVDFRSSLNRR